MMEIRDTTKTVVANEYSEPLIKTGEPGEVYLE